MEKTCPGLGRHQVYFRSGPVYLQNTRRYDQVSVFDLSVHIVRIDVIQADFLDGA